MLRTLTAAVFITALPTLALAATSTPDFVSKASISNLYEIETSKLALKSATRDDVKAFAQQMIDDHTKAASEMKTALSGASAQDVPQGLDDSHKAALDALGKKTGAAFDGGYIAEQKTAHDDAVTLFSDYSKGGDDPKLKDFAAKTLPTLVAHQQHVQQLAVSDGSMAQTPAAGGQNTGLVEGANSFTEAQAREGLVKAGYSNVEGLAKDDKGIWRGKASKDGRSMTVGLDFKGNITAN